MGRETILFKTEGKKSAREISDTLRLIADKIAAGARALTQGGKFKFLPSDGGFIHQAAFGMDKYG